MVDIFRLNICMRIQSNSRNQNLGSDKMSHLITHCYDRQVGYLSIITMAEVPINNIPINCRYNIF